MFCFELIWVFGVICKIKDIVLAYYMALDLFLYLIDFDPFSLLNFAKLVFQLSQCPTWQVHVPSHS